MDREEGNTDDLRGSRQLLKPYAWVGEMGWSGGVSPQWSQDSSSSARRRKAESGR